MTCGAALNIEGQHYGCNVEHGHSVDTVHHNTTAQMMWVGDRAFTDSRISRDTRITCDLSEPHPGLAHSNRDYQLLWTDGTDTTMTSTPTTVEGKRAQRALSDNVTVNRGGPQYTVPTDEGIRVNAPNIQTWGAGESITATGGYAVPAIIGMNPEPQDLMDRARTMRDTYRSAGWVFTITDQEDQSGRRVVIDAFLPDRGEHR